MLSTAAVMTEDLALGLSGESTVGRTTGSIAETVHGSSS